MCYDEDVPELERIEQGFAEVVALDGNKCVHPTATLLAPDVRLQLDAAGWQLDFDNELAANVGCVVDHYARQAVLKQLTQGHVASVLPGVAGLLEDALIEEDIVGGQLSFKL